MRAMGDGPPFMKLGDGEKSPVRYELGEYRKWKAAHTYKNTSQLNVSRFSGLADFLSTGMWGEEYKRRSPPWITLHLWQPARSPLINRGMLFRQPGPLLHDAGGRQRRLTITWPRRLRNAVRKMYIYI